MKVKRAIVREIPKTYSSCVSSHPFHSQVTFEKAKAQHKDYVNLLIEHFDLDITVLQQLNEYPDSCFVEDTVVIKNNKLFICRMGEPTRRGEENSVASEIKELYPAYRLNEPHTLEGGDVIHLEDYLICGITQRTTKEGTIALSNWIDQPVKTIKDTNIVHLKSYITHLGEKTILTTEKYANHPVLSGFKKIIVYENEKYAANTLTINGVTIMPSRYPRTKKLIEENNFEVLELNMDQFEFCEGALTCLSILF